MWDKDADGYARGEGVASVVLKTLRAALEDGDHIECIIRETGINQDGKTLGLTMPSSEAQRKLIRDTYRRAGLDIRKEEDRPQFFQAHGKTSSPGKDVLVILTNYRHRYQGGRSAGSGCYFGSFLPRQP